MTFNYLLYTGDSQMYIFKWDFFAEFETDYSFSLSPSPPLVSFSISAGQGSNNKGPEVGVCFGVLVDQQGEQLYEQRTE